MRKGFTLLELIVVIIIVGVLASLGFAQYTRMIEKSRVAEAKMILGNIRTAEEAYKLEYTSYTAILSNLAVDAPTACSTTHHFSYGTTTTVGTATRCTSGGRSVGPAYVIDIIYATNAWNGTVGYY